VLPGFTASGGKFTKSVAWIRMKNFVSPGSPLLGQSQVPVQGVQGGVSPPDAAGHVAQQGTATAHLQGQAWCHLCDVGTSGEATSGGACGGGGGAGDGGQVFQPLKGGGGGEAAAGVGARAEFRPAASRSQCLQRHGHFCRTSSTMQLAAGTPGACSSAKPAHFLSSCTARQPAETLPPLQQAECLC